MIQQRVKSTFLKRLYPTTKVWMGLAIVLAVVALNNPFISLVVTLVAMGMILHEGLVTEFKLIFMTMVFIGLSLFLIHGFLNPANKTIALTIPFVGWHMYKEGLLFALGFYQKLAPMIACLFLLFRTMNMTDLGTAMQKAGVPYRICHSFISVFQLIPILSKEMEQIMNAQQARGLRVDGGLVSRTKSFLPVMLPVVANAIGRVQGQAIALSTKGFNLEVRKTSYRELEKTAADKIMVVLSIVIIGVSIGFMLFKVFVIKG